MNQQTGIPHKIRRQVPARAGLKPVARSITPREQEVLHLIAHEYSTRQIAQLLCVSFDTAKSHRQNLLRKLGAGNVAGLVRVAFEEGLLQVAV